jgi:hypothetical protein
MTIDMKKQYRTRDGREVRVLMTDAGTAHPIVVAYKGRDDDIWWSLHVTAEGRVSQSHEDPRDLIEVRPRIKREVWANIYDSSPVYVYDTKAEANASTGTRRIACVKLVIDCEEGEGLNNG